MNFNIYYLLIAVTVAFLVGCALGLRVGSIPSRIGMLRAATLAVAVGGYLATLLFLARDAEHGSPGSAFPFLEAAIIALPFLILCVASVLARTRKYEVSVLVIAVVFSVAGTGIYYYFFEIAKDEYAALVLLIVVPVEFVAALIQLVVVVIDRKRSKNETHAA